MHIHVHVFQEFLTYNAQGQEPFGVKSTVTSFLLCTCTCILYQSIEDESICKLGKLIECILECAASSLHQLHALVDTGHSVVGGG